MIDLASLVARYLNLDLLYVKAINHLASCGQRGRLLAERDLSSAAYLYHHQRQKLDSTRRHLHGHQNHHSHLWQTLLSSAGPQGQSLEEHLQLPRDCCRLFVLLVVVRYLPITHLISTSARSVLTWQLLEIA